GDHKRIRDLSFGLEAGVELLDRGNVERDDVVADDLIGRHEEINTIADGPVPFGGGAISIDPAIETIALPGVEVLEVETVDARHALQEAVSLNIEAKAHGCSSQRKTALDGAAQMVWETFSVNSSAEPQSFTRMR